MTREEFMQVLMSANEADRVGLLTSDAQNLAGHDAEQRAEIARLRNLCLETYQVVGSLASDADMFEAPETIKALDNLSAAGHGEALPHTSLLPYPASEKIARLRETLQALVDVQNGAPLDKYRAEWERAMSKAESLLKETS